MIWSGQADQTAALEAAKRERDALTKQRAPILSKRDEAEKMVKEKTKKLEEVQANAALVSRRALCGPGMVVPKSDSSPCL